MSSVPRFVKFSPLWQNRKSFWQFFERLFCIWPTYERTLANLVCNWANCHSCISRNIEKNLAIWSHWLWCAENFVCHWLLFLSFQSPRSSERELWTSPSLWRRCCRTSGSTLRASSSRLWSSKRMIPLEFLSSIEESKVIFILTRPGMVLGLWPDFVAFWSFVRNLFYPLSSKYNIG